MRPLGSLIGFFALLCGAEAAFAAGAVPGEAVPDTPPLPEVNEPPPKNSEQPTPTAREVNVLPLYSKDAPPSLEWSWRKFSTADWVVTATGGALTLSMAIVKPVPTHKLGGAIGFDDAARDALRADKLSDRYIFRDSSDVGLSLAVSWPFAVDALITAWWYRGSREVAQEMALIDLEAFTIVGALQGVTNVVVSRQRPFGQDCGEGELPSDALDCVHSVRYRSFFSGHSAFSFTGAALICTHHFELELLGPPWDALSCAGGYAVAATTASFRVVSDVHYLSDILMGAAVGTIVGYSVPLLHYRSIGGGKSKRTDQTELRLHLIPAPNGLGLAGVF
ncbi:MAG TPA: phosphatase PAP2 family protein [Polyangiaceae bacterium]